MQKELREILKERLGLIGNSIAMQDAIDILVQAAPTDLTVLITGETGTGKEVFSNAVHQLSLRKKAPFVSVNCGAIPETLLESELFGHEKGAFTGAHEQRKGFFEVANKGTIFLDEIGEMPMGTQVKLLRVLESGEFSRLGSSTVHKVDVRVIAATNRALEEEIRDGNFRQDLYFRLKNVHISLPPLRLHPEDIPELFDFFARRVCTKLGIRYDGVALDVMDLFKQQAWPGNIRELKNIIETIITLEKVSFITSDVTRKYMKQALPPHIDKRVDFENSIVIANDFSNSNQNQFADKSQIELGIIFRSLLALQNEVSDMKAMLRHSISATDEIKDHIYHTAEAHIVAKQLDLDSLEQVEDLSLENMERRFIAEALRRFDGNRRLAAKQLGVSERTLYRKISDYKIDLN
jgi:transcriptional regulator with PAS, ATPase and Fis domain